MRERPVDVAVVGAGLVGLSLANALLERHPELSVAVLDKEDRVARHQSARNSGVVHAGLYYPEGSLKARLCVAGRARLKAYCAERGLPYLERGKLVVATREDELAGLEAIARRAAANGVEGLSLLGPSELREVEPFVTGLRALHSPLTAVTDFAAVAESLAADLRRRGGQVRLDVTVAELARRDGGVVLRTDRGALHAGKVVNCAGLHSDTLAVRSGDETPVRLVPFRGEYLRVDPGKAHLVRGLVYPVPADGLPFLGVHLTRTVYDDVWVGPNAVPALAREGYRWSAIRPPELWATATWPGTRELARAHWRVGVTEMHHSLRRAPVARQVQRYVPQIGRADLLKGPSGVRAQALGADGSLLDDFLITGDDTVVHVRNAPSPAATASLAIAEHLADHLEGAAG